MSIAKAKTKTKAQRRSNSFGSDEDRLTSAVDKSSGDQDSQSETTQDATGQMSSNTSSSSLGLRPATDASKMKMESGTDPGFLMSVKGQKKERESKEETPQKPSTPEAKSGGKFTGVTTDSAGVKKQDSVKAEKTAEAQTKDVKEVTDKAVKKSIEESDKEKSPKEKEEGKKKTEAEKGKSKPEPPRSPEEDPGFQAVVAQSRQKAATQKAHRPSESEVSSANSAAPSPENERESLAKAKQVDKMDKQEAKTFDAEGFKKLLMDKIADILPNDEKQADKFPEDNRMDTVKRAASSKASKEKEKAAGAIENTTKQEPKEESVTPRKPTSLKKSKRGDKPKSVDASKAMPKPRSSENVSKPLQDNVKKVDDKMSEAGVTDEQLANSNEPQFTKALNKKEIAEEHSEKAPAKFRKKEKAILKSSQAEAQATGDKKLEAMHGNRRKLLSGVEGQQKELMSQNTAERKKVAKEINKIYRKTKKDVKETLSDLDKEVNSRFDKGADRAKKIFEDYVDKKMDAYKKERYGEWFDVTGWGKRLKDFVGLPDEVDRFYKEGRKKYINEMDTVLTGIANYVSTQLNKAKKRIAEGKKEVRKYVTGLPEDLQEVGQKAAKDIQSKFDQLEQNVDNKQGELVNSLAQKYKKSLDAVDERIKEMKAKNKGLINAALGAITGVVDTIIRIKNMLTKMLSGAVQAVNAIISDPIGFLANLIDGIKQGFMNFMGNILKHLKSGLISWLTGSLGSVGIQIPDNLFSLKGIFSLVMQVLGLTWDYVREKAVMLFGEPVVQAMEKGLELFQILRSEGVSGLWEYVKEQFNDLKETVIGSIKDMVLSQVIQAGVKWIMGLLNPAGAFVKAAMLIIDVVKFFINRGSQIIQLVNAISSSLLAIARGKVGQVAKKVEQALSNSVPVLVGFLASLLGISGLTHKVQKLIKKVRKRIDKAITKVLKKAKKMAGDLLAKLGIGKDKDKPDPRTKREKKQAVNDATKEANKYLDDKDADPEEIRDRISGLEKKYDLTDAKLKQNPKNGKYYIKVKINPEDKTDEEELEGEDPYAKLEAMGYRSGATIYQTFYKIGKGPHQIEYKENWLDGMDFVQIHSKKGKLYLPVSRFLEKVKNDEITLHAPDGESRKRREYLRKATPNNDRQSWAQRELPSGSTDPAFPSTTVNGTAHADHIYPVKKIFKITDFWDLKKNDQEEEVLNWEPNFVPMSPKANKSRQTKSFSQWKEHSSRGLKVDEDFRDKMIRRENKLKVQIPARIESLK